VLDLGCGSGRVGEEVLEAGAAEYVGVDFSEPMLELARTRLARFGDRARLIEADFMAVPLDGTFDVVLALGVFDYLTDPARLVGKVSALCSGVMVASFPRWSLVKGPLRKLRYEVINNCPVFNYTERELRLMFGAAGFGKVDFLHRGRSGFVVRAVKA